MKAGQTKQLDIGDVTPDAANVRKRTDRSAEVIGNSLKQFGAGRSIVMDKDGIVRAGNGTLEGAKAAGIQKVRVIETDGTELIAVKRTDMSGTQATAYAIADNRSSDLATWDFEDLDQQLQALSSEVDLDALGFNEDDIKSMFEPEAAPDIVEDEVPEPPADPVTQSGDLWLLGDHRLLCGDSTKAEDVARLMAGSKANVAFTSPPYASQRKYDELSGFNPIRPDDYVDWFDGVQANVRRHLAGDGSWFVNIKEHCEDGQRSLYVKDLTLAHVRRWGWRFVDEFAWTREGVPGKWPGRFKNGWEPVFHFSTETPKHRPCSVGHESDRVFRAGNIGTSRVGFPSPVESEIGQGMALPSNVIKIAADKTQTKAHSAPFPVPLPSFFIKAFSDASDAIFDPFLGSGTTLIAAEQLNRKCYGMEISPAYCDVIVNRWEALTGGKATLEK